MELVYVGLALVVVGCFSSSVGLLFMKWSADVEAELPFCHRRLFILGWIFLVLNATIVDMLAYALAPLSLIAPFGGLTIVFSSLLAATGWFHVKERLSSTAIACTVAVLLGTTLVSVCGPLPEEEITLEEMRSNFYDPPFLGFAGSNLLMAAAWLVVWKAPQLERFRPSLDALPTTVFSAWTAAACGALSQTFLKIFAVSIKVAIDGSQGSISPWLPGGPAYPLAWIASGGMICTAPTQLYLLNTTLASSSVAFSVPLYSALIIVLTIVAGGLFFRDFDDSSPGSMAVFFLSLLVVMGGLFGLSLQQQQERLAAAGKVGADEPAVTTMSSEPPSAVVISAPASQGGGAPEQNGHARKFPFFGFRGSSRKPTLV